MSWSLQSSNRMARSLLKSTILPQRQKNQDTLRIISFLIEKSLLWKSNMKLGKKISNPKEFIRISKSKSNKKFTKALFKLQQDQMLEKASIKILLPVSVKKLAWSKEWMLTLLNRFRLPKNLHWNTYPTLVWKHKNSWFRPVKRPFWLIMTTAIKQP